MALTLVLWDIDGTLISNSPASRGVYPAAFHVLTGRPLALMVDLDGRTELDIMDELLRVNDVAWPGADRVCEVLAAGMRAQAEQLRAQGRVLPGAVAALGALRDDEALVQTLLTGNIRANAEAKLAAFDLDQYVDFAVGGYGSDDKVRARLVGVAQQRASASRGGIFGVHNTVVIGDTVRDITAAREGGARVIAVATGADSVETLRRARPDVVLGDLSDARALHRAVLSEIASG